MDNYTLRKVQLVQLEIVKEIKRICIENDIHFFLTAGTLLGAVRHKGFIPWDDDLDVAMLKDDYDKFCVIAKKEMNSLYELQNWDTDFTYPYEIGKIRKKNTVYVEGQTNPKRKYGIYVDVIVYCNAPKDKKDRDECYLRMLTCKRKMLMCAGERPWYENGKTIWWKRVGYVPYKMLAFIQGREKLVKEFSSLQTREETGLLYPMVESKNYVTLKKSWYENSVQMRFEDDYFPVPVGYDEYLTNVYGDYMELPPVDQRENRHQIIEVSFGDEV